MSFGQRFKRQGRGQRAHSGIQSIFGKRKPRKHYPSNLNNGINYNSGRVPPFWRQQHPASQQYPQYPTSQQYPQYPASQQYPQYPASQQYPQYPASQQYPQYPVAQQQQAGQQLSPEQRSQNDGQLSVYLFKYSAPDNVNEEELHAYERAFRSKWDTFNDPNKKPYLPYNRTDRCCELLLLVETGLQGSRQGILYRILEVPVKTKKTENGHRYVSVPMKLRNFRPGSVSTGLPTDSKYCLNNKGIHIGTTTKESLRQWDLCLGIATSQFRSWQYWQSATGLFPRVINSQWPNVAIDRRPRVRMQTSGRFNQGIHISTGYGMIPRLGMMHRLEKSNQKWLGRNPMAEILFKRTVAYNPYRGRPTATRDIARVFSQIPDTANVPNRQTNRKFSEKGKRSNNGTRYHDTEKFEGQASQCRIIHGSNRLKTTWPLCLTWLRALEQWHLVSLNNVGHSFARDWNFIRSQVYTDPNGQPNTRRKIISGGAHIRQNHI